MIRVFPNKKEPGKPPTKWTPRDDLAFYFDPPLDMPPEMPVRISVTFTWDISEGERLYRSWSRYYSDVQIGGPAFDDPGGEFVPSQFVKEGVTVTSRGCPKNCPWCLVPIREGGIRELAINPGYNIFDNNLLACSRHHIEAVFNMLREQKEPAQFSGGLDVGLLRPWHIDLLKSIRVKTMYFACDTAEALPILAQAASLLFDFSRNVKFCYVLVGINGETVQQAEERLIRVFSLGFMPYAMLYRGLDSKMRAHPDPEWRKMIRKWTAPGRYKAFMRDEFGWKPEAAP